MTHELSRTNRSKIFCATLCKTNRRPHVGGGQKINEHRLNQKRTTLAARISKLVYSLDEHQVDEWAAQMDAADKVRLSARVRGIHAGIKSSLLIQGA